MNKPLSLHDLQTMYQHDLSSFIKWAFCNVNPNTQYHHNWHIDLIADKLMQCYHGDIKRLIINVPPRSLKSFSASVAFTAWLLANNPSAKILCTSYGDGLVKDLSLDTRNLMNSPAYRTMFPNSILSSRKQKLNRLVTLRGDYRLGVPSNGPLTGRGGEFIIIDDPLKASDANTKELDKINYWYDENVYQRLNNKNCGVIILIMQRLHIDDLTAHLLSKSDDWHLCEIKAIAEEYEVHSLSAYSGSPTYTRNEGEALNPKPESLEQLNIVKRDLGGYTFASQYQQRPESNKASILRKSWFPRYDKDLYLAIHSPFFDPHQHGFHTIIQSWDTALTDEETSDFSACITLAIKDNHSYILDVYRGKHRFKGLLETIQSLEERFNPDQVIVERCPGSISLIDELRDNNIPVNENTPVGNKHDRACAISGQVESGFVHLPQDAPWLDDFLREVTQFPNVRNDDQLDAFRPLKSPKRTA